MHKFIDKLSHCSSFNWCTIWAASNQSGLDYTYYIREHSGYFVADLIFDKSYNSIFKMINSEPLNHYNTSLIIKQSIELKDGEEILHNVGRYASHDYEENKRIEDMKNMKKMHKKLKRKK